MDLISQVFSIKWGELVAIWTFTLFNQSQELFIIILRFSTESSWTARHQELFRFLSIHLTYYAWNNLIKVLQISFDDHIVHKLLRLHEAPTLHLIIVHSVFVIQIGNLLPQILLDRWWRYTQLAFKFSSEHTIRHTSSKQNLLP